MATATVRPRVFHHGPHNIPKNDKGESVAGGPWLLVDGLEARFLPNAEPHVYEKSKKSSGYYDSNNSRLAVCDAKGKTFVTWASPVSFEALHEAGFAPGSMFIPLSNGEQLTDKNARQAFETICEVQRSVDDTGINGNSVNVTGKEFTRFGADEPQKVPDNKYLVGQYAMAKTGVIAFVNMKGETRIGLKHDKDGYQIDLEERLKECGYQKSAELKVPFGQGETPVKRETDTPREHDEFIRRIARIQNTMVYKTGLQAVVREEQKKLNAALASAGTPESAEPDRSFLRRSAARDEAGRTL